MREVCVDKKYRIVLPKELRKPFGVTAGSILEAESRKGVIILKPKVPIQKPTEALWGMAKGIVEESPKKVARKAIAKQSRLEQIS
ncbi:MAG TPA: AbrB/MazE/SpoVT family DNA-binding domain-containing protein [Candidatus Bathyarchaeia archaeon]|nr:AbrB/MazE/SpoVT family DNA-binding domain-containing protein [Candidatus Bathyarchaeia archaeon]